MTLLLPMLLYLSIAIFLAGMGWRFFTWLRAPAPLKIVLTPGPASTTGVVRRLLGELTLFRSLFRADRALWGAAWLFHFSLLLLALGHIGGLLVPEFARAQLGLSEEQFGHLARVAGGGIGILATLPLFYLLARRLTAERLRYISTFSDYFALGLLLLIMATGNHMRFSSGLELAQARQFVSDFLALHPGPPPSNPVFVAHLLLVSALLAYIPSSKLAHLGGLVFSPALNQKNNPREHRYA